MQIGREPEDRGFGGIDLRARRIERGLLRVTRGARGVESLLGREAARTQFALTLEISFGIAEQRLVAHDLRFNVHLCRARLLGLGLDLLDHALLHEAVGAHLFEVGARGVVLGADLIGIEPCHDLVGFHLRIIIGEDFDHLAGQLRADDHGRDRIDRSGRAHGRDHFAALGLGQAIGAFRRRAAPLPDDIENGRERERGNDGDRGKAAHGPEPIHKTRDVMPISPESTLRFG